MEDVLDVYHRPYNANRPVVCIDEASKELHSSPRPDLPAKPGRHGRKDYEYAREGTRDLFMTVEPLTGHCSVRVTQRCTYIDYAEHLRWHVDEAYPDAELVVVVNDNLNTHTQWPVCTKRLNRRKPIVSRTGWRCTILQNMPVG